MNIVFLKAPIPLTKTYVRTASGAIEKHPYPNAYEFTSIEENCADMKAFEALLKKHAALGHTLLKGLVARPLSSESRKGSTDSNGQTDWVVFDLDGIPGAQHVEHVLTALGFADVSYVVQYSASYGIENMDLRAHVFMQLSKPMAAPLLKQWLIDLNHRVGLLSTAFTLTKTGNGLSWPLDITACQNDKLIYIAPPVLKGGIKDPMAKKDRIKYVAKAKNTLTLSGAIPTTEANKDKTSKQINDLRAANGLPARKFVFKMVGAHQVLTKPDGATISDMKTDRGFVYFNLNGGDSWAYYHPEDNPDFIFNFKGEPTYVTKELLPEYWEQITQSSVKMNSAGMVYLTLLDKRTSVYYRGIYDSAADLLELNVAKNETQVRHFAKQHGVPLGDYIPEWELKFDPHSITRVDVANKVVNTFERTIYAKAKQKKVTVVPTMIHKVIHHALGGDDDIYDHFINWLACIMQFKTRTLTAWILHGTEGTGKGAMMHKIIRPLLGAKQTAVRPMEDLNEKYTDWQQNIFVTFIDEIEAKALNNERGVGARMRNWITEPTITMRAMHQGGIEIENLNNWILSSNQPEPVVITVRDRRFNIAKFQPTPLVLGPKELAKIESELQTFHDYMMSYKASMALAAKIIDTEDRRALISISETSVDVAVNNVLKGNLDFFLDQLPSDETYKKNALRNNKVEDYKEVLLKLIDRTSHADGACHILRDELQVMFAYVVGNVPETPNKFTSMLKHHRIHMGKVWVDGRALAGISTTWTEPHRLAEFRETIMPTTVAPVLKIVKKTAGGKK